MHGDVFGCELEPATIGNAFDADRVFRAVGVYGCNSEDVSAGFEGASVVRGLQSEAFGQHLEQGLFMGKQRPVGLENTNAEGDAEAMAQVDIAQVAALGGQPMGFCHLFACRNQVTSKAFRRAPASGFGVAWAWPFSRVQFVSASHLRLCLVDRTARNTEGSCDLGWG